MTVYLVVFLISINLVFSYPCARYYFKEQGTNNPVANVEWVIWACGNSDCSTINPSYWYLTGNTGTNSYADIKFRPTLPPSGWYLILAFHTNYIYQVGRYNIHWASKTNPNICDYYSGWGTNVYFTKKSNCRAPSSLSVRNKIGEWLPLTIDTSTQLDSETSSAIRFITNTYYPPEQQYQQYVQVATDVILIKDKKTNQVVFSETKRLNIPWDQTRAASFTFGPSNPNYKAGNYTVELRTRVVDSKCSSQVDDVQTLPIEIFRLPDDACVIIAEPMTIASNSVSNQQVNINVPAYYYHLRKSYDSDYNLHLTYTGITSSYTLSIKDKNNNVQTLSGSFPKSFNDVRVDTAPSKPVNTISWTPTNSGYHDATLTMTSTDSLCVGKENDLSRGTRTNTFIGMF